MSLPTFFTTTVPMAGDRLDLHGREAWHALGVRRLSVGDSLRVIDGRGSVALARVETIDGPHAARLLIETRDLCPRPQPDILLATAIAKGDRQSTLLDMATQLGIRAWQPLACSRSVSRAGKHSTERWQRICLEACKQSGAAWLPEIRPEANPVELVVDAVAEGRRALLAHPGGESIAGAGKTGSWAILVGPEGGFTDDEVSEMLAAGAEVVSLGSQVLRIETAAVALLARLRIP